MVLKLREHSLLGNLKYRRKPKTDKLTIEQAGTAVKVFYKDTVMVETI